MRHELNVVIVDEEVRFPAVPAFIRETVHLLRRGFEEIRVDFSDCPAAFPDGMVPLIAQVERLRSEGIGVTVSLPADDYLRRLFLNTSWSHFLLPDKYDATERRNYQNNYPLHRFSSSHDQTAVVNGLLDVIIKQLRLTRDVLDGIEWSFNEITDNVLNWAESGGGFAQANWYPQSNQVRFTVADAGVGILTSMRHGFPDLNNDTEALGEAIKSGVTSNPRLGQGNGLAGTLRIATLTGGRFLIASGRGSLTVSHRGSKPVWVDPDASMKGTVVSATLVSSPEFRLVDAFDFAPRRGSLYDIIDARYTDDEDALRVKLKDEAVGFGSRLAGRQLRTEFLNLLDARPDQVLILDWSGVPVVSSSFADEAIGKLFVELGPTAFGQRVRNMNMEALVRNLIDKAIIQRVTQTSNG